MGGVVERVWVTVNDAVVAGQRLATIDTADLRRALRQAEIALEQAELALATAVEPVDPEELRVAEAALANAANALEVARLGRETARVDAGALLVQAQRQREQAAIRYREAGDGSEKERALKALEEAEAEERIASLNATLTQEQAQAQWQIAYSSYIQAQTNLEALGDTVDETTVRQRELQVEQARLRLQQAERTLEEAVVTAPHTGIIAEVRLLEGVPYRGGDTAFLLVDASEYYVELQIDEIDIGALSIGQRADLSLDAYPESLLCPLLTALPPLRPTSEA
jgi:multidrug resistance efflux pump